MVASVTTYGRLSFPAWTAEQAYKNSLTSDYPVASPAEAAPSIVLLLDETQQQVVVDGIKKAIETAVEADAKGEKYGLKPADAKSLLAQLDEEGFAGVHNLPIKPVNEKSQALAPDTVVQLTAKGYKGKDLVQKAIVRSENELAVNDGSVVKFPLILPIDESVHELYPGSYATVTIGLRPYYIGKVAGIAADIAQDTVVFKSNADRFGGGAELDVDAMFLD